MKTLILWFAAILLGLAVGIVSAFWMAGWLTGDMPFNRTSVAIEGWESNWAIGSDAADPYTRAYIARRGLLAMNKSESVYFLRETDSSGEPLREACNYVMEGGDMPSRWWSVTLYAADDFLAPNQDDAHSVDASDFALRGGWRAVIQSAPPSDDVFWISSRNAGRFNLALRLYSPDDAVLEDVHRAVLPPEIRRTGCRAEEGA